MDTLKSNHGTSILPTSLLIFALKLTQIIFIGPSPAPNRSPSASVRRYRRTASLSVAQLEIIAELVSWPLSSLSLWTSGLRYGYRRPSCAGTTVIAHTSPCAQVVSHLLPIDLLQLARASRYFRSSLLSKTSKHIWVAARRNVPGLPDCPDDIPEPAYAHLLFDKFCDVRNQLPT
jgi:hypothetical protein